MMTIETNVPVKKYFFNIREYHLMGKAGVIDPSCRVELINGEIIEMGPTNSLHAGTVKLLNRLLSEILNDEVIISIQDPIELNQYSEPEPDLAILKYRDDLYTKSHPKPADVLLIIEVADTSLEKDRSIKLPLYAAAGIKEAWIVNLEEQQIEVSTEPDKKGYANLHTYRKADTIEHALIGELQVNKVLISKD